jgi:hypothetical protein
MVAFGGFILGFDGEKDGVDELMIDLIEEACINFAMVGLLVALPNTQLTRRLLKERRLLSMGGRLIDSELEMFAVGEDRSLDSQPIDQTIAGLNFRTQRSRKRIMEDLVTVVSTVYEPKRYFDRVLRLSKLLKVRSKHRPRWFEIKRDVMGFFRLSWELSRHRDTRYLYWRNFFSALPMGVAGLSSIMNLMGAYVHFRKQVVFTVTEIRQQIPLIVELDRRLAEQDMESPRPQLVILNESCSPQEAASV